MLLPILAYAGCEVWNTNTCKCQNKTLKYNIQLSPGKYILGQLVL